MGLRQNYAAAEYRQAFEQASFGRTCGWGGDAGRSTPLQPGQYRFFKSYGGYFGLIYGPSRRGALRPRVEQGFARTEILWGRVDEARAKGRRQALGPKGQARKTLGGGSAPATVSAWHVLWGSGPNCVLRERPPLIRASDATSRRQMQMELKSAAARKVRGITFIVRYHDQEEAMVMSDRIGALLRAGESEQVAAPSRKN